VSRDGGCVGREAPRDAQTLSVFLDLKLRDLCVVDDLDAFPYKL
jgi:hypothetical protein